MITEAFAQSAAPAGGDFMSTYGQFIPLLLIFVIMWFMILRPQQRRAREHQEMLKNVRRGDVVVTTGGIVAKVTKVPDDGDLEVEIADNTRVRLVRSMIADVRTKSEPVRG